MSSPSSSSVLRHAPSPPSSAAATSPSYRGGSQSSNINNNINSSSLNLSLSNSMGYNNNTNNRNSNSLMMNSGSSTKNSGNIAANNKFAFDSKQHTIDVLTQELNGARAAAKRAQDEVALLRHQLAVMRGQLSSIGGTGAGSHHHHQRGGANSASMRPPVEEAWIIFSRSVLAMSENNSSGSGSQQQQQPPSPNSTILRTLHQGTDIEVPSECDYVQLSALAEACRLAQPHIRRLTIDLNEGSHTPFVNGTITSLASLQELCCSRVTDTSMFSILAPAISAHPELEVLELPDLMISDEGAQQLRKALSERHVLADAGAAAHLRPMTLDFSKCYFKEPAKFTLYGGDVETLIFDKQKFFTFPEIRSSLEASASSPWLQSVSVSGTMVDNRICSLLNESFPNVVELNVVDCPSITHINLKHVTHLHTDGRRVVEFNCPNLLVMASPLTSFAPATIKLPKLDEISFLNATMTKREMELLGINCGKSLTVVKFLGCRLESLETLMRQLRRLEVFSLHSCKGVRDSDLKILFEPLIELDLTDNFMLTDNVLDSVAACPFLERLSLKRCQNITDVGIGKLEAHPSLEYLNLLGVKKVSAAAVQRLVRVSSEQVAITLKEQEMALLMEEQQQEYSTNNNNINTFQGEEVPPPPVVEEQQQEEKQEQGEEKQPASEEESPKPEQQQQQQNAEEKQEEEQQPQPQQQPEPAPPAPAPAPLRPRTTKIIDVRHATAVSTDALIERDDDEEKERDRINSEERLIERRKKTLAAFASTYDARVGSPNSAFRRKPSASPRNAAMSLSLSRQQQRGSTMTGGEQQQQQQTSSINNINQFTSSSSLQRPATKDQHRGERSVNFVPGTDL